MGSQRAEWHNWVTFTFTSRFAIAFLPRSNCFLISWLQSPSAMILEPKKIKSVTVSIVSPSICHEVMGPGAMNFSFECLVDPVDHNKLWKPLKRWDYQTILPYLWVRKQHLEPCMEQLIGSRLRTECDRAVCCHPVCLTYMLSTSWEMPGWIWKAWIKTGGRNINNLRYADDNNLMAEPLDEGERR